MTNEQEIADHKAKQVPRSGFKRFHVHAAQIYADLYPKTAKTNIDAIVSFDFRAANNRIREAVANCNDNEMNALHLRVEAHSSAHLDLFEGKGAQDVYKIARINVTPALMQNVPSGLFMDGAGMPLSIVTNTVQHCKNIDCGDIEDPSCSANTGTITSAQSGACLEENPTDSYMGSLPAIAGSPKGACLPLNLREDMIESIAAVNSQSVEDVQCIVIDIVESTPINEKSLSAVQDASGFDVLLDAMSSEMCKMAQKRNIVGNDDKTRIKAVKLVHVAYEKILNDPEIHLDWAPNSIPEPSDTNSRLPAPETIMTETLSPQKLTSILDSDNDLTNEVIRESVKVYCICGESAPGEMIGCDGKDCEIEWFHMTCMGFEKGDIVPDTWYCSPECSANLQ